MIKSLKLPLAGLGIIGVFYSASEQKIGSVCFSTSIFVMVIFYIVWKITFWNDHWGKTKLVLTNVFLHGIKICFLKIFWNGTKTGSKKIPIFSPTPPTYWGFVRPPAALSGHLEIWVEVDIGLKKDVGWKRFRSKTGQNRSDIFFVKIRDCYRKRRRSWN